VQSPERKAAAVDGYLLPAVADVREGEHEDRSRRLFPRVSTYEVVI
jgi:hypothetical protein